MKIINPVDLGYTTETVHMWRSVVKWERKFRCEWDGCDKQTMAGVDLHECIVTRQDARGLPDDKRIGIFSNCNMVNLCRAHHEETHGMKDSRLYWWDRMCKVYGEDEMREWYARFEWKAPENRFMPIDPNQNK